MTTTDLRSIVIVKPHPKAMQVGERLAAVESQSTLGQLPGVRYKAEGSSLYDPWDIRWIEFRRTIFVANAGLAHAGIVDAVVHTSQEPLLHAYDYPTTERLEYFEEFIRVTPSFLEKAFLVYPGTEAIEVANKLMRMNATAAGKRRAVIVRFEGNWHGRTAGVQQLSSNVDQRARIGHTKPSVLCLPFPYPGIPEVTTDPGKFFRDSLQLEFDSRGWTLENDIAGFMLETYQGWGAVLYPLEFVKAVAEEANANGCLLALDEMQAGFARTGEFSGYQHYSVDSDLVYCGNGASSSVSLAFVLGPSYL
jgi:4-aminobutyrate aminotransferase-like enzyme